MAGWSPPGQQQNNFNATGYQNIDLDVIQMSLATGG